MTVSYQYDVASSTSGGFTRLLFKWEGSLYKLIYKEFALFCVAYVIMSAFYRYTFTENMKRTFEQVAFYCDTYMNYIPLSFILGFYVSFVASRWWQQYMAIPWPDKLLHVIALYVHGNDERARIIRRSMVRYLNLSLVLVLRSISSAVKKRFPTLEHLVEAGFITSQELQTFNLVPNKEFNTYWVPCTWFTAIIREARHQKRFTDPSGIKIIMEEFSEFRQKCGMLWSYDWVSIPLVYTQVVTIATYSFFIAAIVGRQFLDKSPIPYRKMIDIYVPFFTILQFFFYMGLLKVAEQLINPFGDDDEDFELNWIIDRHMKVSYLIVDTLINRIPPLTKDIFFDVESVELPYTEASASFKKKTYRGSVANMIVPEEKQHLILPDITEEEDEGDQGDDGKQSIFKSSLPSCRASVNFLNNMETNPTSNIYLTVPEDGHFFPDNKPSTNRSNPPSRNPSKRSGTAGSKGINSALMFAGCHQGLHGSDTTSLGEPIIIDGLQEGLLDDLQKLKPVRAGDELDYLIMPFKDVCLNIDDSIMESCESKDKAKSKNVFSSLQAKIAMRRKPVIKWKPYVRPDHLKSQISLEYDQFSRENLLPPGVFEDECAFMWRTIEDEAESLKAPSFTNLNDELEVTPISSDSDYRIELSHYSKVKPKSVSRDSTIDHDAFDEKLKKSKKLLCSDGKHFRTKRHRFRIKGKIRHSSKCQAYKSLQHIPSSSCRQEEFISKFLRCLSESSVFIDVIGTHMKYFHTITSTGPEFNSQRRASAPLHISVIPTNLPSTATQDEAIELHQLGSPKAGSGRLSKNISECKKADIPLIDYNKDIRANNRLVTDVSSSREASFSSSKNSLNKEPEYFISREKR